MTTHTPGPWIVERENDRRRITADGYIVATMLNVQTDCPSENAALIAAAPDLLEALAGMIDIVVTMDAFAGQWSQVQAARAAIAKAKGQ